VLSEPDPTRSTDKTCTLIKKSDTSGDNASRMTLCSAWFLAGGLLKRQARKQSLVQGQLRVWSLLSSSLSSVLANKIEAAQYLP
jgi:hypothetical protein